MSRPAPLTARERAILDRIADDLRFRRDRIGAPGCDVRVHAAEELAALERLRAIAEEKR